MGGGGGGGGGCRTRRRRRISLHLQRIVKVKYVIYNKIQFMFYYGYGQCGLFYGNIMKCNHVLYTNRKFMVQMEKRNTYFLFQVDINI